MKRWLMISNRLPVSKDASTGEIKLSSGGLVSALGGIRNGIPKLWIGLEPREAGDPSPALTGKEGEIEYRGVPVDVGLYDRYYNGISNDVLWPLFHYEGGLVHFNGEDWDAYVRVNELLADAIAAEARDDESVWIHDFHLFLLPAMLRKRKPSLHIGFFLHIPFPSSEIFRQLPVREEILQGIMGADLIGFHDYSYLRHFCNALHAVLGVGSDMLSAEYEGRRITLGAFPVSIDTKSFHNRSREPAVEKILRRYRQSFRGLKLILGIDRLDYIKGLRLKLQSFRELLARNPELVGEVQLLQIAVPTRQDVPVYIQLKEEVERLVGEINGRFGRADYAPVLYIYNSIPFEELLALYRLADCLLVSSRRDGMNLVALEFIAAQSPTKPGVVVLSEFTGASATLSHALTINPWDVEKTSEVLKKALSLSDAERREMHQPMLKYLMQYDATDWAASFMKSLEKTRTVPIPERLMRLKPSQHDDSIRAAVKPVKLLVCDYDGTLVPIQPRPEDAYLRDDERRFLQKILDSGYEILVISGRSANFLEEQFGNMPVTLAAEHGATMRPKHSTKWKQLVTTQIQRWYPVAETLMKDYSRRVPGSVVEKKKYAIVWHYRQSPASFASYMALKLGEELAYGLANQPVEILPGNKIVEARAVEANKGTFLRRFLKENPQFREQLLVAGDDRTDEDLFRAVDQEQAVTIKVGPGASSARYRVDSPADLRAILTELLLQEQVG
ncbi:bifunctional alpha,alpha-trehalose-phosphate synthase (UDP-forming)/trehalose-phosphatase [Leptonema illini]|uniref:Glucosylglycerol-phosphate synthase n=1 Tax=Leptonema illini DSM 21528 TaxID=929563 RepID=H2CJR9_9LEPT|nr:bifunctional alpha,alpha-trehalose-phosphate synthase (UDP-forming)/trehalose-phosphatase [Leptonema illini]EHQ04983.1 trehalose-phosphatase [Leptonema illini DSM 21528]